MNNHNHFNPAAPHSPGRSSPPASLLSGLSNDHVRIALRMVPEEFALLRRLGLGVGDVRVWVKGEPKTVPRVELRAADRGRRRAVYYGVIEVGGRESRFSTKCAEGDSDGAVAVVLGAMARAAAGFQQRIAPETTELCDVFATYAEIVKGQVARGEITRRTGKGYLSKLVPLARCFGPKSTVADVQRGGTRKILDGFLASGYKRNTALFAADVCKRAVNAVMTERGSPWRLTFRIGLRKPESKQPFEPDEIDRIMEHLETGTIYGKDNQPLTRWDEASCSMVRVRCTTQQMLANIPFVMALPFMLETGTRKEAACEVTFTDPTGPFLDLDLGTLHRRGAMTKDRPNKRRGSCVLSSAYMTRLRPIAERLLACGVTHLIHNRHGRKTELRQRIWARILACANVEYRKIHCLKDTAVQIARREGVSLRDAAERFATKEETLSDFYGADWDLGNQIDAAEAQGERRRWRQAFENARARRELAEASRRARGTVSSVPRAWEKSPPAAPALPARVAAKLLPAPDTILAAVRGPEWPAPGFSLRPPPVAE